MFTFSAPGFRQIVNRPNEEGLIPDKLIKPHGQMIARDILKGFNFRLNALSAPFIGIAHEVLFQVYLKDVCPVGRKEIRDSFKCMIKRGRDFRNRDTGHLN